jgi:hypothetical protein
MLKANELVLGKLYKVTFEELFSMIEVPVYKDNHKKVNILGRVPKDGWVMLVRELEPITENKTKVDALMVLTSNDLCGYIHVTNKIVFEEYNL